MPEPGRPLRHLRRMPVPDLTPLPGPVHTQTCPTCRGEGGWNTRGTWTGCTRCQGERRVSRTGAALLNAAQQRRIVLAARRGAALRLISGPRIRLQVVLDGATLSVGCYDQLDAALQRVQAAQTLARINGLPEMPVQQT